MQPKKDTIVMILLALTGVISAAGPQPALADAGPLAGGHSGVIERPETGPGGGMARGSLAGNDNGAVTPSGPLEALAEIDLASDLAWTLSMDDGPPRAIKVPGGGWNSDRQEPPIDSMAGVKDFVTYQRKITIPSKALEQVASLRFGAVTYGCEVFLDGRKVGDHQGPQVAFEVDLTSAAIPGKEQTLAVKAYHRRHYFHHGSCDVAVGWDFVSSSDPAFAQEAKRWCWWFGNSKVGYGICRSIKLVVLPAVHVEEVLVRPSVSKKQFSCDVWVRNATASDKLVKLASSFSSWNGSAWQYPAIAPLEFAVPARSVRKVILGPVPWDLGPASYWWPNIPFREDYVAILHCLSINLTEASRTWQMYPQRFGFVEHAEGPFYYTVNGVRVTGLSDATAEGQISFYDAYGSAAAFQPATGPGTGCPETWRRYMRIGINSNRTHCSPPTQAMLDAADEVGFMLIPEAPIWGNGLSRFNPDATPQSVRDMGRHCRNHPSVARYSLTNEVSDNRDEHWPWRMLIDAMLEVDDSHPLVFELNTPGSPRIEGLKSGHASVMEHYTDIHLKGGDHIRGMGEHFWQGNSMGEFAVGVRTLRLNDWCYMAGWSWLNYWPNFLAGMSHDLHAWKPQDHADRKDAVDGWGSPIVSFTQRSLHPYLVQDRGILETNPERPHGEEQGLAQWPYQIPECLAGQSVERRVEVFNGGLLGKELTLRWSAHWDHPDGPLAVAGADISCQIEPGFHATKAISFIVPKTDAAPRKLFLVLESWRDGKPVFREDSTWMNVVTGK